MFLSDGRPGELSVQLPQPGSEKATARVQKQEMASAPATVRQIAEKRGRLLTVHAVAIGPIFKRDVMRAGLMHQKGLPQVSVRS